MSHTFRSREEIESQFDQSNQKEQLGAVVELLLDVRAIASEILDAVKKEPVVNGHGGEYIQQENWKPERDPLFDAVKVWLADAFMPGAPATMDNIRNKFGITIARASAIMDQLAAEGIIRKDGPGKAYRVV